ncbi:SGNH/GDSL hydrolase family protein [Pontibacter sp. JH31]|uniref:SGNH/GDSL hydrolase family protein n=2 Tax=Pontibacter aquaedesilientis TaxID=2766980 RepID=A0ABR7XFF7_9BACT|nr:SGNH/GDSL hydrolase family protein [Pontibacter aquaedesilientis]
MDTSKNYKYTYLALGDSYTIGQGVAEQDQWGVQLADLLRQNGIAVAPPVTIALTGWTTSDLIKAVADAKPKPEFDLVSLLIGVNNQYRGQSIQTYRTEFRQLLQTSVTLGRNNPKHVIVLSIPDWGATPAAQGQDREQIARDIDAFNAVAKEESEMAGIQFINITPLTRTLVSDQSYLASDRLHYSGKMHREWALLALPEVQKFLK